MIHSLVNTITGSPLLLAVAIILLLLIVYAILKRIVKLAIILLLVLTAYAAYLVNTGQPLPRSSHELIQQGRQTVESFNAGEKGLVNTEHWKEVIDGHSDLKTK